MTFIANHLWLLPLVWSVVVTILLGWFLFGMEGEDQMAIPLVFLVWLVAVPGSWVLYGLYHFIDWLF